MKIKLMRFGNRQILDERRLKHVWYNLYIYKLGWKRAMRSKKCKRGIKEKTKRIEKLKELYNKEGIDGLINFFESVGEKYRKKFINFQYDCAAVTEENFSEKSWLLLGFLLRRSLAYSRTEHLIKNSIETTISTLKRINESVDEAIRKAHSLFKALRSLKESFNFKALSSDKRKELLIETITQLKNIQEEAKQKLLKAYKSFSSQFLLFQANVPVAVN